LAKVTCTVSDSVIWNRDQLILDLVAARDPVDIDLLSEGPCCDSIGLDQLLQSIPGLDVRAIHTSNQIASSSFKEVRKPFVELDLVKQKLASTVPTTSTLEKTFAIFVSRSNWQRLGLASYIWEHYNSRAEVTYHYDSTVDYHRANFGLETLLQKDWHSRHHVYRFLEQLPLTKDQQTYPILWNNTAFDLDYTSVFCEIVCETFFTGNTFMMTEKIMRPILQRRPFVVQGPRFFLENLQRLGFKTFSHWWDESYDMDPADGKFPSIKWTIDYIGKQSADTIQQWYTEMQPVLEHNANTLANLSNRQIITTEFKSS